MIMATTRSDSAARKSPLPPTYSLAYRYLVRINLGTSPRGHSHGQKKYRLRTSSELLPNV